MNYTGLVPKDHGSRATPKTELRETVQDHTNNNVKKTSKEQWYCVTHENSVNAGGVNAGGVNGDTLRHSFTHEIHPSVWLGLHCCRLLDFPPQLCTGGPPVQSTLC